MLAMLQNYCKMQKASHLIVLFVNQELEKSILNIGFQKFDQLDDYQNHPKFESIDNKANKFIQYIV